VLKNNAVIVSGIYLNIDISVKYAFMKYAFIRIYICIEAFVLKYNAVIVSGMCLYRCVICSYLYI
jgi:hypothetical protein